MEIIFENDNKRVVITGWRGWLIALASPHSLGRPGGSGAAVGT
ncbi:MAG: hypothetical protein ACJ8F3_03175 [Xanthobacteraceae bacterium]